MIHSLLEFFHLLLAAEMGSIPTEPNADGTDDTSTISPQVLEKLGRQIGSYGVHICEWLWKVIADKHNEVRFGT